MQPVNVKGYGVVPFPDDISVDEIRATLRRRYTDLADNDLLQGASEYGAPTGNVAAPYNPSLMERTAQGIGGALYDSGIISNRAGAQQIGKNVTAIGELLPGIGDVAAVDDTIRAYNKGNYGEAALNAVGVVPLLGDAAIFAGVLAKNADLGALRKAKLLEDTGADRNRIWKETGWVNDNGDWKFEIDDSKSIFDISGEDLANKNVDLQFALASDKAGAAKYAKSKALEAGLIGKYGSDYADDWSKIPDVEAEEYFDSLNQIPDTIGDILWSIDDIKSGNVSSSGSKPNQLASLKNALFHDELYSNYPDAGDITLQYNTLGQQANEAGYNPIRDKIEIGNSRYSDIKSPTTHEVQHAIQEREGFAKGGSPITSRSYEGGEAGNLYNTAAELKALIDEGTQISEIQDIYKGMPESKLVDKIINETDLLTGGLTSKQLTSKAEFEAYQRLGGEAEARNVQTRLDMTPDERRATPPWETLDVPEDELIYRGGSGVSKSQAPVDVASSIKPARKTERLYHASPVDFDEFDPSRVGDRMTSLGLGHYLTPDKAKASQYGDNLMEFDVDTTDIFDWKNPTTTQRNEIESKLLDIVPEERISHLGANKVEVVPRNKEGIARFNELKEQTKGAYNDSAKARLLTPIEAKAEIPSFDTEGGNVAIKWMQGGDLKGANNEQLMTLMNEYSPNLIENLGYKGARFGDEVALFDPKLATKINKTNQAPVNAARNIKPMGGKKLITNGGD